MTAVEPRAVVAEVEAYVHKARNDAKQFTNSDLLDSSGVWSLHDMAARIYALGFADGEFAGTEKARHQARRDREDAAEASP